jgi:hypothetical protein
MTVCILQSAQWIIAAVTAIFVAGESCTGNAHSASTAASWQTVAVILVTAATVSRRRAEAGG